MIILAVATLLSALFVGPGGAPLSKQLEVTRERIEEFVKDEHRRATLLDAVEGVTNIRKREFDAIRPITEELLAVLGRHDIAADELGRLLGRLDAERRIADREALGLRDVLQRNLTQEEWNAVFAVSSPSQVSKR
jgi:hypothetical protein